MNRTGIVFWSCIVTGIVVSLFTTPKKAEDLQGLIWTKESLRLPSDQAHRYHWLQSTALWWAVVTALVLFFYVRFP